MIASGGYKGIVAAAQRMVQGDHYESLINVAQCSAVYNRPGATTKVARQIESTAGENFLLPSCRFGCHPSSF